MFCISTLVFLQCVFVVVEIQMSGWDFNDSFQNEMPSSERERVRQTFFNISIEIFSYAFLVERVLLTWTTKLILSWTFEEKNLSNQTDSIRELKIKKLCKIFETFVKDCWNKILLHLLFKTCCTLSWQMWDYVRGYFHSEAQKWRKLNFEITSSILKKGLLHPCPETKAQKLCINFVVDNL